ncbi:MAG TPA: ribonuclease E/G [Stellaceae bacterium]|nr:ribonuclease E/G [Stellaceae bacterium]
MISASPGEAWVARADGGLLIDLRLVRDGVTAGDVVEGRVIGRNPELGAAFIDIGLDRAAILNDGDRLEPLHEGQWIRVRVLKAARGGKGAGVSQRGVDAGRPAEAALARAVAFLRGEEDEEIVVDEVAEVPSLKRFGPVTLYRGALPVFEHYGLQEAIEGALQPVVPLAGGGSLIIEINAAATMIDVDSGEGGGALAVNLRAAHEVMRQIRLRNLAGPMVIDFVGLKARAEREQVLAALHEKRGGDVEILGWTRLGHMELRRKRIEAPLTELFYETILGGGQVKRAATVAFEVLRDLARGAGKGRVRVSPLIAASLEAGEAAVARRQLEGMLGKRLEIQVDPGLARERYEVL